MKGPRCRHDSRPQAKFCEECAAPLLQVCSGTEDRRVPFEDGRYLAAHIPGAQLHVFEGLGHLPIFTGRREFCDVLRRFVRTGVV